MEIAASAISIIFKRSLVQKFILATFFAVFTVGCARIAIHLPFTPIPVTLQVLGVLVSGLILGSRWGALSQIEYVLMGIAGAPVFAGGKSGIAALLGPTGGYLVGFIFAAFLAGLLVEKIMRKKNFILALFAGLLGVIAIYLFGSLWLWFWLSVINHGHATILTAYSLGIKPFILVDLLKALIAAWICYSGREMFSKFREV